MLLAWRSVDVHNLCAAADGLERHWPQSAATAKDLLFTIAGAPDLRTLRHLRSLRLRPVKERGTRFAELSIQLEEVEMSALVLNERGEQVKLASPDQFWKSAGHQPALLVEKLAAHGKELLPVVAS